MVSAQFYQGFGSHGHCIIVSMNLLRSYGVCLTSIQGLVSEPYYDNERRFRNLFFCFILSGIFPFTTISTLKNVTVLLFNAKSFLLVVLKTNSFVRCTAMT